jgi:hypothetical protein
MSRLAPFCGIQTAADPQGLPGVLERQPAGGLSLAGQRESIAGGHRGLDIHEVRRIAASQDRALGMTLKDHAGHGDPQEFAEQVCACRELHRAAGRHLLQRGEDARAVGCANARRGGDVHRVMAS